MFKKNTVNMIKIKSIHKQNKFLLHRCFFLLKKKKIYIYIYIYYYYYYYFYNYYYYLYI